MNMRNRMITELRTVVSMPKNVSKQDLVDIVCEKIALKQEGASWDFKKEWHSDNVELLFDIICMSNMVTHEDGLIIIGVDEEQDYSICGVENDPRRKKTQDIVCLLRDKKFAFGMRPLAYVKTLTISGHEVDVLVVEDSTNTPFYLTDGLQQIRPYHIYTRVMDTNTGRDKSADPNITERLWKKRFGLDQTALQRAMIYLKDIEGWDTLDGEESHFYKYAPEFTLRCERDETRNGYEYYVFGQIDPYPNWYNIYLYFHQTMIYHTVGISLDGGRYFTAVPDYDSFQSFVEKDSIWFYHYVKGTMEYLLYEFYSHRSENGDSRMAQSNYLNCIPIFSSEDEKRNFFAYAMVNFRRDRKYIATSPFMPHFPDSLPNGTDVDYFKSAYHDALIIRDLYSEFVIGKENLPDNISE